MLIFFFFHQIKSKCTTTFSVDQRPFIYSGNFKKNSIICINSSVKFLTVLFNEWSDSTATVYFRNLDSKDIQIRGPYSYDDNVGGFDFGNNFGSVEVTFSDDSYISLAATIFSNTTLARVISNKAKDTFNLAQASSETLLITNNQHLEYFYGAPVTQSYNVEINSEEGDLLEFVSNFISEEENQKYYGHKSFQTDIQVSKPVVLKWHTDREIVSGYVKIKIESDFHPKKYIRYITDDRNFVIIPYLDAHLSTLAIVLIVLGCIIFVIIIISLLLCYFIKRKRLLEERCQI